MNKYFSGQSQSRYARSIKEAFGPYAWLDTSEESYSDRYFCAACIFGIFAFFVICFLIWG